MNRPFYIARFLIKIGNLTIFCPFAGAHARGHSLWGLQSAPKLSEMDTTWEEHLTPSTHWINAGCQKIKESWLVPALLYCALSGSTVTIKVH